MKRFAVLLCLTALLATLSDPTLRAAETPKPDADGFISLFDGKTLEGWRAGDKQTAFRVVNGEIVVNGEPDHLFYEGPVNNHEFKNFQLKLEAKTEKNSNSGVYFHTKFQDDGWPEKGFEAQVNNSHSDWKRTGGLYNIADVRESKAKDGEWFEYDILVDGKHIVLKVNGETTADFTEPTPAAPPEGNPGRLLSSGTIALQAHDPGSTVRYRNIRIKPMP